MKELIQKLIAIEMQTTSEKGAYSLFALFLREDSPNRWDLLVSAPWLEVDKQQGLRYLAGKIQNDLLPEELSLISRIIIIEENDALLATVQQGIQTRQNSVEVRDSNFFGQQIKHAYLITSQKLQAA